MRDRDDDLNLDFGGDVGAHTSHRHARDDDDDDDDDDDASVVVGVHRE